LISNDSRLLVFDSKLRENFYPFSYTKPGASFLYGSSSLLESIESNLSIKATNLQVPKYMENFVTEIFPGLQVNQPISSDCILVNSFISQRPEIWKFVESALNDSSMDGQLFVDSYGIPVFAKLSEFDPSQVELAGNSRFRKKASTKISRKELPEEIAPIALIRYPWELVRDNGSKIGLDFSKKNTVESKTKIPNDLEIRGNKVWISESADIERFVSLDSRGGPIIIEDDAEIQSFSHIAGPTFIGKKSKVKSARIRQGTTIGSNSKVAGEIECSVISEYSNKSHDGFLGHSMVGSWVNLGALTTCSDLKNTYGKISVKLGRNLVETGEIKLGVFIADMVKTAIGTLLTSGKSIGVASQVFGLITDNVPSYTIYGKSLGARSTEVIIDSVLSTQKKMMGRRGLSFTDTFASLIRSVYKMTNGERAFQRVSKGRFKMP
jgi:UDP-N-acetylglucosamine diphosphorylase / glucose-1-phosphate thymidylyltransferase / UDP-N-acetylgalactosamine diphosphorylase / glucosamine-1-phosphate N-acetyltransferase / galactosamine-1-phosphate N-acetyltransferase